MKAQNKRFLGLDLSLSFPGLAVAEIRGGRPRLLFVDSIETDAKKWDEGQRLDHIAAWLKCAFYAWGPFAAIVREMAPNGRNAHVSRALFGVRAISELCFRGYDIPIFDYAPTTVKKTLTGSGSADKDAVERAVLSFFPGATFRNDNESDALAVILTHLLRENLLESARR